MAAECSSELQIFPWIIQGFNIANTGPCLNVNEVSCRQSGTNESKLVHIGPGRNYESYIQHVIYGNHLTKCYRQGSGLKLHRLPTGHITPRYLHIPV